MAIKASRKPSRPDEWLAGIPNRSLSDEEWEALDPADQERIRESGLYSMRGEDSAPNTPTPPASPPASGAKDGGS